MPKPTKLPNLLIKVQPKQVEELKRWLDKPLMPFFNIIARHPAVGEIKVEFEAPINKQ